METGKQTLRLIGIREVERVSGLKKSELYARSKAGTFPKPVQLGTTRGTRWAEHEVQEWIRAQLEARERLAIVVDVGEMSPGVQRSKRLAVLVA